MVRRNYGWMGKTGIAGPASPVKIHPVCGYYSTTLTALDASAYANIEAIWQIYPTAVSPLLAVRLLRNAALKGEKRRCI
jgi:hypothetical protein